MKYPLDLNGKPTTKEQWDAYEIAMKRHEDYCQSTRPKQEDYTGPLADENYRREMTDWEMMRSCDEPNKPGYYRANND